MMQKGKKYLGLLIPLGLFARWAYTTYVKKQAGEDIADEFWHRIKIGLPLVDLTDLIYPLELNTTQLFQIN